MFGKKEIASNSFSMQAINNIGNGTVIEGNIKTDGDIRIDGKINGNIHTTGRLVLGVTCQVIGDVTCLDGSIDGFVRGNIQVKEILKISKTANIDGNIQTGKLIVEEGAMIQAKISMAGGQKQVQNTPNYQINKPNN
jgi:cytoskeletal protein CcmA (bactofilin family)